MEALKQEKIAKQTHAEYFGLSEDIKSVNDIYITIPWGYDKNEIAKSGKCDWNVLNDHITFKQANDSFNYKTNNYPKVRTFVEKCIYQILDPKKNVLSLGEDRLEVDDWSGRVTYEEYNIHGDTFHVRVASNEESFLEDLVMEFGMYEMLMHKQERAGGLYLFTGDMGSGKSTTIYSFISSYLRENGGEAVTYEEPVEKILPQEIGRGRVFQNHIPLNANWSKIGRRARRFQPSSSGNIILIGEISSYETAKIAVSSALLGTNVISSTHGASPRDVIHNLRDCLNSGENTKHETTNNLISQTLRFISHQRIEDNSFSQGKNWDIKRVVSQFLFNPYSENSKTISNMLKDEELTSLDTILEQQATKMNNALVETGFNELLQNTSINDLTPEQKQFRFDSVNSKFIKEAMK